MTTATPGRLMLAQVRIAFAQSLHRPEQVNGDGQYRRACTLLVEPGSANDKAIQAAIKTAAKAKWPDPKVHEAAMKDVNKRDGVCYRNGDDKSQYGGFAGNMALSVNGKGGDTPGEAGTVLLLDKDKSPLQPGSGKPYSGCYCNASVQVWVQDNKWGKRINCTLRGLQFHSDGDSFGGSVPASADDFDAVDGTEANDFA